MQSTELTSSTHDTSGGGGGGGLANELPPLHADDEGVLVFMRATFAKAELDSVFTVTADDASNFLAKRKLRTVGELRRAQSQGRLGSILDALGVQLRRHAQTDAKDGVDLRALVREAVENQLDLLRLLPDAEPADDGDDAGGAGATDAAGLEPGETAESAAAELDRFVVAGASRGETTGFDPRESPVMLIRDGAPHLEAGAAPAAGERALGLMAHKRGVAALAAGGGFVFSAGGDGALFAWERRTMRLAATVVPPHALAAAAGSSSVPALRALCVVGGHLVATGDEATLLRWELPGFAPAAPMVGHDETVAALAGSEAHGRVFSASADTLVIAWAVGSGALLGRMEGHRQPVTALATSSTALFSGSADRSVREWGLKSLKPLRSLHEPELFMTVYSLACAGQWAVSGSGDLRLWRGGEMHQQRTKDVHNAPVLALAAGRGVVASGGGDGAIKAWALPELSEAAHLKPDQGAVNALALDGGLLFAGFASGAMHAYGAWEGAPPPDGGCAAGCCAVS